MLNLKPAFLFLGITTSWCVLIPLQVLPLVPPWNRAFRASIITSYKYPSSIKSRKKQNIIKKEEQEAKRSKKKQK